MPASHTSLLLFAHGTSDGTGGAVAASVVEAIRARGVFAAVGLSFALQPPSPAEALAALPGERVVVAPLLATDGGIATVTLPRLLAAAARPERLVTLPPVGLDPEIPGLAADLVGAALREAALAPESAAVLVAAHGSTRRANSRRSTAALAAALAESGAYGEVAAAFLEEPPFLSDWPGLVNRRDVVVLPYFLSGGHHEEEDVPDQLASAAATDRRLWITPTIGRHPAIPDIIVRRALAALADHHDADDP